MNTDFQRPRHNQLDEPYRPYLHYSPAYGWLNDPNGLVWHKGEYHMFYQYYPMSTVWGPMHWGHATSRDLITWKHWPIALAPDAVGACFSGSAVSDPDNRSGLFDDDQGLLAYFTSSRTTGIPGEPDVQSQCLAYSKDGGRNWQKYARNPILSSATIVDFRDPKVFWHEANQRWIMVLSHGQSVGVYRSVNGLDWEAASEFGKHEGRHTPGPWECPDLFPLRCVETGDEYWVMVVGIGSDCFAPGSGTQYFIGQFDGVTFSNMNSPETVLWMDFGRDYYAIQSWSDAPAQARGERTAIAWMSNWQYARNLPTEGFRSTMTLPREISLHMTAAGPRLAQRFVDSLKAYRLEAQTVSLSTTHLTAGQEASLGEWADPFELTAELSLAVGSELALWLFDDQQPEFRLCRGADGAVTLHSFRSGQSEDPIYNELFPHDYAIPLGQLGERLSLQLVADHGSTELLLQDGMVSHTQCCFAAKPVTTVRWQLVQGECRLEQSECVALAARPQSMNAVR